MLVQDGKITINSFSSFLNAFNDVGAAGEADRVEQMRIGSRIKL